MITVHTKKSANGIWYCWIEGSSNAYFGKTKWEAQLPMVQKLKSSKDPYIIWEKDIIHNTQLQTS